MNASPWFADASDRLLSALGNGLLQGVVLGALLWCALRAMGRANAATRHAIQFAALLVVAALPFAHWLLDARPESRPGEDAPLPRETIATDAWVPTRLPNGGATTEIPPGLQPDGATETSAFEPPALPRLDPEPMPAEERFPAVQVMAEDDAGDVAFAEATPEPTSASQPESTDPVTAIRSPDEAPDGSRNGGWPWLPLVGDATRLTAHRPTLPVSLPTWTGLVLVGAWLVVALARLGRVARQLVALRRLKREAEAPPKALAERTHSLHRTLGIGRGVGVGLSPGVSAPMIVGYRRPMILLPAGMGEASPADLEPVLRHELAHLARCDDWTNLVQQLVHAVFFFHPTIAWLSRRLTLEREIACDDHVLSALGRAREYALFLADFARRNHGREWLTAPAAWSNPSQLERRIDMILDHQRNASPRLARGGAGAWITAVLLLAVLGLYAAPRLAVAAASDSDAAESPDSNLVIETTPPQPSGTIVVTTETPVVTVTEAKIKPPIEGEANTVAIQTAGTGLAIVRSSGTAMPHVHLGTLATPPKPGRIGLAIASASAAPAPAPVPAEAALPAPPIPPVAPKPEGKPESLEQRLERLEKLVESLAHSKAPKPGARVGSSSGSFGWDAKLEAGSKNEAGSKSKTFLWSDGESFGRLGEELKAKLKGLEHSEGFEAMSRIMEQVSKQVEQAVKEAERAVQSALKSTQLDGDAKESPERREAVEARRKALDAERRALQKQIARVESQLERLDGQLDRVDNVFEAEREADKAAASLERAVDEQARIQAEHQRAMQRAKATAERMRREAERIEREAQKHASDLLKDGAPQHAPRSPGKEKDKSGDQPPTPSAERR